MAPCRADDGRQPADRESDALSGIPLIGRAGTRRLLGGPTAEARVGGGSRSRRAERTIESQPQPSSARLPARGSGWTALPDGGPWWQPEEPSTVFGGRSLETAIGHAPTLGTVG